MLHEASSRIHELQQLPDISHVNEEEKQAVLDIIGEDSLDVNEDELCVVCMDSVKNAVFIPCGHVATCFGCSSDILSSSKICPICSVTVSSVHQIYMV